MRRLILQQAREDIAEVLGVCSTDPVVVRRLNEAQERLLNRSTDPVGSWQRFRVCTSGINCVVLPREVRHVKAWWLGTQPGLVLPEWYENLGYWDGGRGMATSASACDLQLIDRGTACCFHNVTASSSHPKRIQVVASDASDNGKFITLRYVDAYGNRVYTNIDGTIQEGERLTLSTAGTLTTSNVLTGGLYHVVKAVTNYPVRLYEWDTNSALQVALMALYAPSETTPIYREMFIPGGTTTSSGGCGCGCGSSSPCSTCSVITMAVKLQHIPVIVDNDPLVIGNLPALKDMVQAMLMRRRHEYDAADRLEASAAGEIDGEVSSYLGDGALPVIRTPDRDIWGGAVFNPV